MRHVFYWSLHQTFKKNFKHTTATSDVKGENLEHILGEANTMLIMLEKMVFCDKARGESSTHLYCFGELQYGRPKKMRFSCFRSCIKLLYAVALYVHNTFCVWIKYSKYLSHLTHVYVTVTSIVDLRFSSPEIVWRLPILSIVTSVNICNDKLWRLASENKAKTRWGKAEQALTFTDVTSLCMLSCESTACLHVHVACWLLCAFLTFLFHLPMECCS